MRRPPARTVPVPGNDLAARILQDLAETNPDYAASAEAASAARRTDRVVAFDHAPLGAAGTLVAHVIALTDDYDWGVGAPELRLPKPGERVVLGSGTLFTEEYMGAPVIGVRPDDGREEDWMDRCAISRCKDHLVRLEFEMAPTGEAAPAGTRPAQIDFPARNPLDRRGAATPGGQRPAANATRRRPPQASGV